MQRTARSLSKTRWLRWFTIRFAHPLDLKLRGTRFAPSELVSAPLCYLTTTGRKSGEPREVPLLYVWLDDTPVVVASNYGQQHHPAWSHNLDANPNARLDIDGTTSAVVARRATADEQDILWPRFEEVWPGYQEYQKIAPRDIKMYVLEAPASA